MKRRYRILGYSINCGRAGRFAISGQLRGEMIEAKKDERIFAADQKQDDGREYYPSH